MGLIAMASWIRQIILSLPWTDPHQRLMNVSLIEQRHDSFFKPGIVAACDSCD